MNWGRITEAQSVHVGKILLIFVVAVLLGGVALAGSATGQEVAENKMGNETKGYGNYSDTGTIGTLDTTRRVDLT